MASYTNLTTREEIEYVGGTQTRDVIACSLLTVPHGVYYEFREPRQGFTAALVKTAAENGAAYIEETFTNNPNLAGIEWIQVVTPAGLLADTWVLYVTSDSGNSSASVQITAATFSQARATTEIDKLAAELNAVEAG